MDKEIQQVYENHQALWNWLAENPGEAGVLNRKEDWPGWVRNGGEHENISNDDNCFMCKDSWARKWGCESCLIEWNKLILGSVCSEPGSPFYKWSLAKTPEDRAIYAAQVRDLPLKKKVSKLIAV